MPVLALFATLIGYFNARCPPRVVEVDVPIAGLPAPLHGFRDTDDYWARGSAKPHLARIRVPALVLNARNDPFVPAACLPRAA